MAKKKAKTKKAAPKKKAVKRRAPKKVAKPQEPKLEIKLLMTDDRHLNLYRITFGNDVYYAGGCRFHTEKEALSHWNPRTYYPRDRAQEIRAAMKAAGKKITREKFLQDGDTWGWKHDAPIKVISALQGI